MHLGDTKEYTEDDDEYEEINWYNLTSDLITEISKKFSGNEKHVLKYCSDVEKSVVIDNFERRGWQRVEHLDHWNVYWASVKTWHALFTSRNRYRLKDNQMINHFPNHYELTRKDCLARNIHNYRKELEKLIYYGKKSADSGKYIYMDFMPDTFILPHAYSLFVEEYKKNPGSRWIMKPSGSSRGVGIFLVQKLSQVQSWKDSFESNKYIVSRYVENPLLIGGKKFDLRLYVLVTSFYPLKVYLFKHGFCRFCTVKYAKSGKVQMGNILAHLTNVSLQKHGVSIMEGEEEYNRRHGGKWSTQNLRLYLESTIGRESTRRLFDRIKWMIVHSLKAVSKKIINDRHCFECYGYDIIIDRDYKPWLIEVNAAPSLISTTAPDRILKFQLIKQLLDIILPPNGEPDVNWPKIPPRNRLNDFELLLDEEILTVESDVSNARHAMFSTLLGDDGVRVFSSLVKSSKDKKLHPNRKLDSRCNSYRLGFTPRGRYTLCLSRSRRCRPTVYKEKFGADDDGLLHRKISPFLEECSQTLINDFKTNAEVEDEDEDCNNIEDIEGKTEWKDEDY